MNKSPFRILVLAGLALLAGGCSTTTGPAAPPGASEGSADVLRVGVTPNYPPIVFEENGEIAGLEADFARNLGRPVKFVKLRWNDLIPALRKGKIDVIMSGMSITTSRSVEVAFTDPYLKLGQAILVPARQFLKYEYPQVIRFLDVRIGVEKGTTGDLFVQQQCRNAKRVPFSSAEKAAEALARGKVDVVLHDATVIWKLAGKFESKGLIAMPTMLTEEYLAWAVRRDDTALLKELNAVLDGWKRDGTLQEMISRWIPVR